MPARPELDELYLPPFASGIEAGAPVIMTSHIAFPQISGDETPTTLSKQMLDDLRARLGFQGVILSDAMRMKGVTGAQTNIRKTSLQALQAGVDLLLLNFPGHAGLVHAELVDAVLEKRLSEKRLDEAVRRVLILKAERGLTAYPGGEAPEPDWQANQQTVDAISGRTITVLRDAGSLIPLPGHAQRILVVSPQSEGSVDEALVAALEARGDRPQLHHYPAPWGDTPLAEAPPGDADLAEILAAAQNFDRVVVFTWQAHLMRVTTGADWQAQLVAGLQANDKPVVVVAMQSPTDLLEFSEETTVVGMMGTTPAQQAALVAVLMGEREAEGVNPLAGSNRRFTSPGAGGFSDLHLAQVERAEGGGNQGRQSAQRQPPARPGGFGEPANHRPTDGR